MSGDKILKIILAFFVTAWTARYLGPSNFGLLSYSLALVLIFEPFSHLGLKDIQKRYITLHPDDEEIILNSGFLLRLMGTIFAFILLNIFVGIYHSSDSNLKIFTVILAFGFIFKSLENFDTWFEFHLKSKSSTIIKTGILILTSILKIWTIIQELPLKYFIIIFSLEFILTGIFLFIGYYRSLKVKFSFRFSKKYMKTLISESWPLFFSGLAGAIFMRFDQLMLKNMIDEAAVGNYSIVIRIVELWYIIPMSLTASMLPSILKVRYSEDLESYNRKIQKQYTILTYFALAISIPLFFTADFFIFKIFGNKYLGAPKVLMVYIWALFPVFWGVAQGPFDLGENILKFGLFRIITGMILNICLNILWIPKYGIVGAAYATMVSSYLVAVILNVFHPKARKIFKVQLKSFNFLNLLE